MITKIIGGFLFLSLLVNTYFILNGPIHVTNITEHFMSQDQRQWQSQGTLNVYGALFAGDKLTWALKEFQSLPEVVEYKNSLNITEALYTSSPVCVEIAGFKCKTWSLLAPVFLKGRQKTD